MLTGETFAVNVDEVFSVSEFIDALREKLGEHKFEVLNQALRLKTTRSHKSSLHLPKFRHRLSYR